MLELDPPLGGELGNLYPTLAPAQASKKESKRRIKNTARVLDSHPGSCSSKQESKGRIKNTARVLDMAVSTVESLVKMSTL